MAEITKPTSLFFGKNFGLRMELRRLRALSILTVKRKLAFFLFSPLA